MQICADNENGHTINNLIVLFAIVAETTIIYRK